MLTLPIPATESSADRDAVGGVGSGTTLLLFEQIVLSSPPPTAGSRLCRPGSAGQNPNVPTHVALLRGINVGGRNRVAMADLRAVGTSLAHTDVSTYIQSGNVVFTSTQADTAAIAAAIERGITESLSVRPTVVVLSRDELSQLVADNPYPDETNPKCLHAEFTNAQIGPDELAAIATAQQRATGKGSRDEVTVVGRTLFLRTPDGLGRSELAAQLARASGPLAASGSATVRN
ncbi:MAG: DUF1697 domain-containing protein, partial [Pseudonocardiaceae bacterium]